MVIRRRLRKLGLRRAGSLVRPTRGCASSVCAMRGSRRAQVAKEVDGAMSSLRRRQWQMAELGGGVRARKAGGTSWFIPAGGQLGASGVTPVTHARVEKPRLGRRRASLRRPMARHGRCAGRWSDARHSAATGGLSGTSACAPDAGTARTAACRRGRVQRLGRARSGVLGHFEFADTVFKHDFL
jgi:hypothetical protein